MSTLIGLLRVVVIAGCMMCLIILLLVMVDGWL